MASSEEEKEMAETVENGDGENEDNEEAGSQGGETETEPNEGTVEAAKEEPKEPQKDPGPAILWAGVSRDDVLLAEHLTLSDASKAAEALLMEPPNSGWDFLPLTGHGENWQGCKIQLFQRNPIPVGQRVKVRGLKEHAFMNGQSVRIQEYRPETDKYVCKPTIPLTDRQDLHQSILLFKARNIVPQKKKSGKDYTVFTFATVYNTTLISKESVCGLLEKLFVLSDAFREAWGECGRMEAQEIFGAMIQAQIELYDSLGAEAFADQKLDIAESLISRNIDFLSEQTHAV